MLSVRLAQPEDVAALLEIYQPYVENTAITFEYTLPSRAEFEERMLKIKARYPYLVAVLDGRVVGYCYASAFKGRAAYDWAVETSIYVDERVQGRHVGRLLYEKLEALLRAQHILNVNACIVYPHPQSIGFHERFGYRMAAHFHQCGYKLGRWWDMVWMEKMLDAHEEQPEPVCWFPGLSESVVRAVLADAAYALGEERG